MMSSMPVKPSQSCLPRAAASATAPLSASLALLLALAGVTVTTMGNLGCATGGLPDAPVVKDYAPTEWVANLKSGLTVIVKEDHSAPQVTVASVYGVGSTSDPKGVEGLAHFIEHLAFRSRPGGGPQYWDVLKRMGGNFNASTSQDFTSYFTIAHKSNLPQMMQLEAWRLARTIDGVTPAVFTTEREVVRSELRQRWETTANNRLFDMVFETLYPATHPLRRPIGGTHESLTAATLDHAKAFVKEFYKPDNCTIVISGDFDTEAVKKMLGMWPAEILFGPEGPQGAAVAPRPRVGQRRTLEVPAVQTTALKRFKGPIAEPTLVLAWSLPPGLRGQDTLAEFAASRLNLALAEGLERDEDDDIEGVGASADALADSSVIFMFANLREGADPEKARRRLLDVLVNAWTTDLGRVQTESGRWRTATQRLLASADPVSSAIALARYAATTGKTALFNDEFEELAALKDSDVADFSHKWLTRERAGAVFFEPESSEIPRLVGGSAGATGSAGAGQSDHRIGNEIAANDVDFSPALIRKTVLSPGLATLPHFKLANGLEVFVLQREGAPVVQLDLKLRGGDATTHPVGAAGIATNLSRSRCRDHGSLNPVGGSMGFGLGLASSDTRVTVLSGNLANAVAVLSDRVRCMEADEEAFLQALPRIVERESRSYALESKRPEFLASQRLTAALYPNHPLSQVGSIDPKAWKDLRRDDAQSFVQSHFRPENGALAVFGDVDLDAAKKESEQYLALWPAGGGAAAMDPPAPPAGPSARQIFLVDRPKATQASVSIGCRMVDSKPELLPAFDVLEELADEKAWELREKWGATYGIAAGVGLMPGGATELTYSGAIDGAQVGKSVARLLEIIGEMGAGTIDERTFATKRWEAGIKFMNRMAPAGARARALLDTVARRWPIDAYDKYPDRLASTTPATLKEILGPCVGKEVVAIVGDAATLRPQLEKAGLRLESK
jgi:zinc protease